MRLVSNKRKNLYLNFWLLCIAAGFPIVPFILGINYYQTNDDVIILGRASGIFYGKPISDLIYVSPPLSNLLASAYSFNDSLSWYAIFILTTQTFSIYVYLKVFSRQLVIRSGLKKIYLLLLLIIPILIVNILFISLQYNQTSIIASGLGTLAFLYSQKKLDKAFTLILVFLGVLWRYDSSLAAIGFILFLHFIYQYIFTAKISFELVRKVLPLLLIATVSYSFYYLNNNEWAPWLSDDKKSYMETKNLFTQIYGYESTKNSFSDLSIPAREIGWSQNDWEIYSSFYFVDQDTLTFKQQEYIAENRLQENYLEFAYLVGQNLLSILNNYLFLVIASLAFSLLLSLFSSNKKSLYFYLSAWVFITFFFYLILFLGERLPERILYPFIFLLTCYFAGELTMRKDTKILNYTNGLKRNLIIFSSLIFILSFSAVYKNYSNLIEKEIWWQQAVETNALNIANVYQFEPDKSIIAFSSFYEPFRKTLKPSQGPAQMPNIWKKIIFIGWDNLSPEFLQRIREEQLSSDLLTSVAQGDAYLATLSNLESNFDVGVVSLYLKENKNLSITWEEAPFIFSDTGLAIWRSRGFEFIE